MSHSPSGLVAELSAVIGDPRVLDAIVSVPRERFLPEALQARAYENVALPIECNQTISQPLVVARMLELLELRGSELVLDIGTGSGYHAALLACLAGHVVTIERHRELSIQAEGVLASLGLHNVELIIGDGSGGLPDRAPFDAINVAAAAHPHDLDVLASQLAPTGRLVAPMVADPRRPHRQRLVVIRSDRGGLSRSRLEPVRFVPLVPETRS